MTQNNLPPSCGTPETPSSPLRVSLSSLGGASGAVFAARHGSMLHALETRIEKTRALEIRKRRLAIAAGASVIIAVVIAAFFVVPALKKNGNAVSSPASLAPLPAADRRENIDQRPVADKKENSTPRQTKRPLPVIAPRDVSSPFDSLRQDNSSATPSKNPFSALTESRNSKHAVRKTPRKTAPSGIRRDRKQKNENADDDPLMRLVRAQKEKPASPPPANSSDDPLMKLLTQPSKNSSASKNHK
jgi:hypothetical protein